MTQLAAKFTIRKAARDDAVALTELANFAGEGMPLYLWGRFAEEGQSGWEYGRERIRREEGGFSYRNAIIAEVEGVVAACHIGYRTADEPEAIDYETMPAMFVPLQELENLRPGHWYTEILSAYPQYRGQGFGTALLAYAENKVHERDGASFAIIVSDANEGARRLYERCGY
jgi:ribosomal protein S18 acetylase RimI-like enzyme